MAILWWIVAGLIAGWATGKVVQGSSYGPPMDIVFGIVGALIGGLTMRALGYVGDGTLVYTLLIAVLSAVALTWIVRLATGAKRQRL